MKHKKSIVWFRNDLRLHDNEALTHALQMADIVVPVYVFDERLFSGKTQLAGFPKISAHRAKFIWESVRNLKQSLQALGSDLVVRIGLPEVEIFEIAKQLRSSWVFCNREPTPEEAAVQDALEKNLWAIGQEIFYFRGKMLYYTQDLPFPIPHTPNTFTAFRKEVERIVPVRDPLPSPTHLNRIPFSITIGAFPDLADLGIEAFPIDQRAALAFHGGETHALERLQHFFWDTDAVAQYKDTRNEMLGADYSSKFSPWLASGCLSPKLINAELQHYESERTQNESTYWLFFELLWRDYFRLIAKRYQHRIFLKNGLRKECPQPLSNDMSALHQWIRGQTGTPFVDAHMRELAATGFMSNRGRQNVASYLINEMGVNWQLGAEYFESMLIDYDVASNWCNWNYLAGVGCDPRGQRHFNIASQAATHDPHCAYVRHWLPEYADIPTGKIHEEQSH